MILRERYVEKRLAFLRPLGPFPFRSQLTKDWGGDGVVAAEIERLEAERQTENLLT